MGGVSGWHVGPERLARGAAVLLLGLLLLFVSGETRAAPDVKTPYFAALKADEVHVRKGPGRSYDILWTYRSLGLPVEVTAEHEHWRRVRDSTGAEGWVYFRLITSLRMALIAPWEKTSAQPSAGTVPLFRSERAGAAVVAKLEPGVKVLVKSCNGTSCLVSVGGFAGWISQKKLWGVYPGEIIK